MYYLGMRMREEKHKKKYVCLEKLKRFMKQITLGKLLREANSYVLCETYQMLRSNIFFSKHKVSQYVLWGVGGEEERENQ